MDEDQVPQDIVESLEETLTLLARDEDLETTLGRLGEVMSAVIPKVGHVGFTMIEDGKLQTIAATDPEAKLLDEIQYEVGEGPCLEAAREHEVVEVRDIRTEERWPRFLSEVSERTEVRSMLAHLIQVREDRSAALNVYATQPAAFNEEDKRLASIFAAQSAVAISRSLAVARSEERATRLQEALATRDTISAAKGLLMARENCTATEAFEILRRTSQNLNVKVRDLAQAIIQEHESEAPPG